MTSLDKLQKHWDELGRRNPFWAVLSAPEIRQKRWQPSDFYLTGERDVAEALGAVEALGIGLRRGRALDFGSGVGRLTQALARRFERVLGVDISPSMIRLATARNAFPQNCEYQLNLTNDLQQLSPNHFDFVLSLMTLQHIPPRYATHYLAELVRVLRPGGVAVIQVPERTAQRFSRAAVKALVGRVLFALLPSRLYPQRTSMEIYPLSSRRVALAVQLSGGSILAKQSDQGAGPDWQSYHYVIKKSRDVQYAES